ncbi:hypothetical protein N7527_003961 [Penicillium freii]|uniref:Uncharacterized protein n=1 Tax=Penicillium freii TaxID=48697 RepID=A0A101M7K8_PENFR|nr:hypothetical protein N7527_003961 [Penicillium freii]KUM55489.1 hypothetical protein ACN42_g11777 [Penicillium freii]
MFTRIRVRAAERVETRERIIEEAHWIMATIEDIMGHPSPHLLPLGTLLQAMEQRMQDLVAEMGGLCIEAEHDTHIGNAIWGETGVQED